MKESGTAVAALFLVLLSTPAAGQELVRLAEARRAWETWQAASVVPGPRWARDEEKAAPAPPLPQQSRNPEASKVVQEAERCVVQWHSRRPKRPSQITCYLASR